MEYCINDYVLVEITCYIDITNNHLSLEMLKYIADRSVAHIVFRYLTTVGNVYVLYASSTCVNNN